MVLQRDAPLAIWGEADSKQAITVTFADQIASTTADTDGAWRIELKPLAAYQTNKRFLDLPTIVNKCKQSRKN